MAANGSGLIQGSNTLFQVSGSSPVVLPISSSAYLGNITIAGDTFQFAATGQQVLTVMLKPASGPGQASYTLQVYNNTTGVVDASYAIDVPGGGVGPELQTAQMVLDVANVAHTFSLRVLMNTPSSANAMQLLGPVFSMIVTTLESGGGGVLDGADIYPSEPAYPQFFQLQASGSVLANAASIAKDILNLYPITFPARMLAKQIGMRYASGGDASFKLKFGLYDLNSPRNLVWESAERTVTAAGTYSDPAFVAGPQNPLLSPLNVTIEPKTYLFAVLHNSVASPIFLGGASSTTKPVLYADSGATGEILSPLTNRLSFTQVYTSSLPASLTGLPGGSSANNTVNIPYLFFRT